MYNKKQTIFFVALLIAVQLTQAKQSWPFMDFDEIEQFFDRQFEEFNQHVRNMHNHEQNQTSPNIVIPVITLSASIPVQPLAASIEETDEQVLITITQIETQEIDARLNDENTILTLCTSQERIEIEVENNCIQVHIRQEQSRMGNNDSTCTTVTTTSVSGDPELGTQTIDYDLTSCTLTISIPKKPKEKTGKSVPVTMRQSDKESDENEK